MFLKLLFPILVCFYYCMIFENLSTFLKPLPRLLWHPRFYRKLYHILHSLYGYSHSPFIFLFLLICYNLTRLPKSYSNDQSNSIKRCPQPKNLWIWNFSLPMVCHVTMSPATWTVSNVRLCIFCIEIMLFIIILIVQILWIKAISYSMIQWINKWRIKIYIYQNDNIFK